MRIYLIFLFSLLFQCSFAQTQYKGKVIDAKTKVGIPFANLVDDSNTYGTSTDIDGQFSIVLPENIQQLWVSTIGYSKKRITLGKPNITVALDPLAFDLDEVLILPGVNPAHRIIRNATENKWKNNPKKQSDFSVKSYSKLVGTAYIKDSADVFKAGWEDDVDTSKVRGLKFLEKQHIFLTETASQLDYKRPNSVSETIIATRMSGLKNPIFTLMSSQMQSFSFYENQISVLDNQFLNPLSSGSEKKYLFILKDSIPQGSDTVFVIQFQPRSGKNFKGLSGVISIHSDGFGIQSVIAEPSDSIPGIEVQIRQLYTQTNGFWFPTQLNTRLVMKNASINEFPLLLDGKTYFDDIELNPAFAKNQFKNLSVENMEKGAGKKGRTEMEQFRTMPLSRKDSLTYSTIDSIGKAENLDKLVGIGLTLARGSVPWGKFDLPIQHWMDYNGVEGFRLGFGAETNEKFSSKFSVGAYGAYGFRDRRFKYGTKLKLPMPKHEKWSFALEYKHDVLEPGLPNFSTIAQSLFLSDMRRFYIQYLEVFDQYKFSTEWKINKSFSIKPSVAYYDQFASSMPEIMEFQELRYDVEMDWWPGRSYSKIMNVLIPVGSSKPRITSKFGYGEVSGLSNWTRLGWKYGFPKLGVSSHELLGFASFEDVRNAFTKSAWKASEGSGAVTFAGFNTFEAKPPQLPNNNYQLSYYFSHNFKDLLLSGKKFKPEFRIRYGLGLAWQDLDDGVTETYHEFGFEINKLIKLSTGAFGVGVYTGQLNQRGFSSPVFKVTFEPPF